MHTQRGTNVRTDMASKHKKLTFIVTVKVRKKNVAKPVRKHKDKRKSAAQERFPWPFPEERE